MGIFALLNPNFNPKPENDRTNIHRSNSIWLIYTKKSKIKLYTKYKIDIFYNVCFSSNVEINNNKYLKS